MVPVLDPITTARVRRSYEPTPGHFLDSTVNLILAIDEATQAPRSSQLQKRMGELTIHALELELPFIKEGLVWGKQ